MTNEQDLIKRAEMAELTVISTTEEKEKLVKQIRNMLEKSYSSHDVLNGEKNNATAEARVGINRLIQQLFGEQRALQNVLDLIKNPQQEVRTAFKIDWDHVSDYSFDYVAKYGKSSQNDSSLAIEIDGVYIPDILRKSKILDKSSLKLKRIKRIISSHAEEIDDSVQQFGIYEEKDGNIFWILKGWETYFWSATFIV